MILLEHICLNLQRQIEINCLIAKLSNYRIITTFNEKKIVIYLGFEIYFRFGIYLKFVVCFTELVIFNGVPNVLLRMEENHG